MSESQAFVLYQPLLHSIAHRITGCAMAAEDIVQDTYLKWLSVGPDKVRDTKAYLVRSVRNNCLKYRESLMARKSEWLEQLPSGWLDRLQTAAPNTLHLEEEIRSALAMVQQRLEPLEKGVFILRGIFQLEYEELQHIFEKRSDHCRQLFSRARKKLKQEAGRASQDAGDEVATLWTKVDHAFRNGALNDLIAYLKK